MPLRSLTALCLVLWSGAALAQGTAIELGTTPVNPDAPVEITADSLSVDRETGFAIFTGNVRVVQEQMTLSADVIEVRYTEADKAQPGEEGGVDQVDAKGNVIFINGEDVAESDNAVLTPRDDRVVMTGNVLLTQGPTVIAGERMVFNLATGAGRMEGRVRTVIRPGGSE